MNIRPSSNYETANLRFGKKSKLVSIPNTLLINNKSAASTHKHNKLPKILMLAMLITSTAMPIVNKYTKESREKARIEYFKKEINKLMEQLDIELQTVNSADTLTLSSNLEEGLNEYVSKQ